MSEACIINASSLPSDNNAFFMFAVCLVLRMSDFYNNKDFFI